MAGSVVSRINLPESIQAIKNPREVFELDPEDLRVLLAYAHDEMFRVEKAISRAEETLEQVEKDKIMILALQNNNKERKKADVEIPKIAGFKLSPVSLVCLALGELLVAFSGYIPMRPLQFGGILMGLALIVYAPIRIWKIRNKRRKALMQEVEDNIAEADRIYEEAQQIIDNAQTVRLIPSDYRYTLALSTMLKFLDNGRADTWRELADKYDLQLHQWTLEKDSKEALMYQSFTALKMEETADATKRTAGAATVSAVVNLTRLFMP